MLEASLKTITACCASIHCHTVAWQTHNVIQKERKGNDVNIKISLPLEKRLEWKLFAQIGCTHHPTQSLPLLLTHSFKCLVVKTLRKQVTVESLFWQPTYLFTSSLMYLCLPLILLSSLFIRIQPHKRHMFKKYTNKPRNPMKTNRN